MRKRLITLALMAVMCMGASAQLQGQWTKTDIPGDELTETEAYTAYTYQDKTGAFVCFGWDFTLLRRISDADFARIKKYGRYYDEEFLEDCDMFYSAPGWRFGCQAVEELAKDHWVFVDDEEVVLDKVNNENI